MLGLFELPTVAALAENLDRQAAGDTQPIRPIARERGCPLSFAQERMWFLDQYEDHAAIHIRPVCFISKALWDVVALERSLNMIVGRHDALRSTFQQRDGMPVAVISEGRKLALPILDVSELPEPDGPRVPFSWHPARSCTPSIYRQNQ